MEISRSEISLKKRKKWLLDPSAYRRISLTSYPCKILERILTHGLFGFSEHFNLLDPEQEGFRRFRGTTDALLRLTQDIFNGFNNKEHTAALFIDIEKAFNSVWREGVMFKLHKLWIRGRMWKWIKSFLNDQKAFINMKGDNGREFKTTFGLTSWLSFVVSSVSLSLSHWYPGSGVVLDCIDS